MNVPTGRLFIAVSRTQRKLMHFRRQHRGCLSKSRITTTLKLPGGGFRLGRGRKVHSQSLLEEQEEVPMPKKVKWLESPEAQDYPSAADYLHL
ncbi:hypothetical protein QN355_19390, partial [Cryobacterium sp. 10S3]|uniref:hypothetical protein n=1 Tax=Cryobacterium sp. 10S3 TaxID=3048582 RepID=UPI002B235B8C